MLNNANGASVWTQLVQITALTNWLDSSQQSWGVCQSQVLGAGRGARAALGCAELVCGRRWAGECGAPAGSARDPEFFAGRGGGGGERARSRGTATRAGR